MGKKGKKGKSAKVAKASASAAPAGKAAAGGAAKDNRALPSKEKALFNSIIKLYESKMHKKALKASDSILKKYPDHGETMAMKGLTLNAMGKKEEAMALVKSGLKHDMRSHICWHVLGLVYRANRDYMQAIKSYRNALRMEPGNKQILADLALLQIQMRDLKGYVESRRQLLTAKPSQRNNWIGFAVSHHAKGNLEMAVSILGLYETTLDEKRDKVNYEESEMLLYKNRIIEEIGDLDKCMAHLESIEAFAQDRMGWQEKRAMLLIKLGRFDESAAAYEELLGVNNENYCYHRGYQTSKLKTGAGMALAGCDLPLSDGPAAAAAGIDVAAAVTPELRAALTAQYQAWTKAHPRSNAYRRILLDVFGGDDPAFAPAVDAYLKRGLKRGVPALFSDVSPLLRNPAKAATISGLIASYVPALRDTGRFPGEKAAADKEEEEGGREGGGAANKGKKGQTPDVLCWALMVAAQESDFKGDQTRAIELIDEAIAHTPTALDLYRIKGRIVKHGGDVGAASVLVERARAMDLADRYINTKSVKYLLRSHQVEKAEGIVTLFTRHDYADPLSNLFDMQVMWYELECGETHERDGDYGQALKKFHDVETHFRDIKEDQFDFHTYCLRKMTMRAYTDLLRMADTIHGHPFFIRAAQGLARCYRALHELKQDGAGEEKEPDYSGMSKEEKKKAKQMERLRKKKEAEAKYVGPW